MSNPPADWYQDPTGRFDYRYWDGRQWTGHVSTAGSTEWDPLPESAPADEDAGGGAAGAEPDAATGDAGATGGATTSEQATGPSSGEAPAGQAASGDTTGGSVGPAAGTVGTAVRDDSARDVASDLLGDDFRGRAGDGRVGLQNPRMLRVTLGADVIARQGSMVAFQGEIDFDHEGPGSIGRLLKKAVTGEGLPLMRCTGTGELFLAHDGDSIHVVTLEDGGISVNGGNLLAFDPTLEWDIERVGGAAIVGGGLFNTTLRGTGWVAVTAHGTPVTLRTDRPTYADMDAAIAWSADLEVGIHRTVKARAVLGRGSGELAQLAFSGTGFVVVQASEGAVVPSHDHG